MKHTQPKPVPVPRPADGAEGAEGLELRHDQVRRVTIEGGRLSIIASDRAAADGRTFHSELTWLKV
jgi:hypothetical protein